MNPTSKSAALTDEMSLQRHRMVDWLRDHYNIADERVLTVMGTLPRHKFVPAGIQTQAYNDNALPIAGGQTISQPFIVARMTELLELKESDKVLEIGAGSGYQTAVLASLARKVFAIERLPNLANEAAARLRSLSIGNISIKTSDGTEGWSTYMPYDAILVAAGGPSVPEPLVAQLETGGRLVIPIGEDKRRQELVRVTKTETGNRQENFGPCAFVPLIGEHGW
ncbi:MAG: protein-L-isoaspartate(D-aspartate) O-methyltransferase [Pyrinomonadaceae bacterium]